MVWAAPRTWITGEVPTAAQFNQHLRDNFLFVYDWPTVRLRKTAAQSIPNSAWTAISWNSAAKNNDNIWAAGSPTILTCHAAGEYQLAASMCWAGNATNARYLGYRVNGGTIQGQASIATSV